MIPDDATLWAAQVAQAYALADNKPVSAPAGWTLIDELVVTDQVALWKSTCPCGFVLETDDDEHAVVIRGTDSILDLLLDFQALLVPLKIGSGVVMVEAGFLEFFSSIRFAKGGQTLSSWISLCAPGKILFAGHSLGAAAATIGARLAIAFGMKTRRVVFACPRTGDGPFQNSLAGLTADSSEIDNVRDIVPREPPEIVGFCSYPNPDQVDSDGLRPVPISIDGRHALSTYQKLLV